MSKKIIFSWLITVFVLSACCASNVKASSDHRGELIKMDGLSSVYYVATNGKRYVFPNSKIYFSWFSDFEDVKTLSREELGSITLGGNVLYRPGVVLIKTQANKNVYAVTKGGILRSIRNEANAKALYGNSWNKLIDDVPESFFTNYTIGQEIYDASDFDLEDELDSVRSIDANRGLSKTGAKLARTKKCQFTNQVRNCKSESDDDIDDNDDENNQDDNEAPYIDRIQISNSGGSGYINTGDKITITFNKEIDPLSINSRLENDSTINSLDFDITGAINVYSDGKFEIVNIASFDLGKVDETGKFSSKISLSSSGKSLTIELLAGEEILISDEDFEDAEQIGGTVKDESGNKMSSDSDIGKPDGTFGGENVNDGIEPYITSIRVNNNGQEDYIDTGDEIRITFSEAIDPESINNDLDEDTSVDNVDSSDTGGVSISSGGVLRIKNIASFYVGQVEDNGNFDVKLALNEAGTILTITLQDGEDIGLTDEDLDDAEQIGDTVEDKDGNEMDDDPNISDPSGTFIGDSTGSSLFIDFVKAYDDGFSGYIDEGDKIVITFSEAIESSSVDVGSNLEYNETGGVHVDSSGIFTITDIMSFDVGTVANSGRFETKLSLSSNKKVLTVNLVYGEAIEIEQEIFSNTNQIGGYIINDENNSIVMEAQSNIENPTGTFGGDSIDTPPYIIEIEVDNGDRSNYIDKDDRIIITFNESIDPESIDRDLELDGYITNVDNDDTGGVNIDNDGRLSITDIAEFNIGDVEDDGSFDVKLALNSIGNILTITLEDGSDIEIIYEDLDDAEQIGGTIEDKGGSEMEDDPRISDPEGSF